MTGSDKSLLCCCDRLAITAGLGVACVTSVDVDIQGCGGGGAGVVCVFVI